MVDDPEIAAAGAALAEARAAEAVALDRVDVLARLRQENAEARVAVDARLAAARERLQKLDASLALEKAYGLAQAKLSGEVVAAAPSKVQQSEIASLRAEIAKEEALRAELEACAGGFLQLDAELDNSLRAAADAHSKALRSYRGRLGMLFTRRATEVFAGPVAELMRLAEAITPALGNTALLDLMNGAHHLQSPGMPHAMHVVGGLVRRFSSAAGVPFEGYPASTRGRPELAAFAATVEPSLPIQRRTTKRLERFKRENMFERALEESKGQPPRGMTVSGNPAARIPDSLASAMRR